MSINDFQNICFCLENMKWLIIACQKYELVTVIILSVITANLPDIFKIYFVKATKDCCVISNDVFSRILQI